MPKPRKKDKVKKIRCFAGLDFSRTEALKPLREQLDLLNQDPAAKLRQVSDDNLHLTLKFLGSVPEPELAAVKASLGGVTEQHAPLQLEARGVGVFRNSIWVGIADNPGLAALAAQLDSAFEHLGVQPDNKPFVPHITIARLQPGAQLALSTLLEQFRETDWGSFTAGKVSLYRSDTLPEGARYTVIKKFRLGSDPESPE